MQSSSPLPKHQSPLQQNPVSSPIDLPSSSTQPTQTRIWSQSTTRLSSSPASSPRIIDSPPLRTKSIRPETSELMDKGLSPGRDFFEDSSGEDGSEWEDCNVTRDFSEVEGLGIRTPIIAEEQGGERRGRQRGDDGMRAFPSFSQISTHDYGIVLANDELPSPLERKGTKKAREMSLHRFGKARVIHNLGSGSAGRGSPHESIVSYDSENVSHGEELLKPFPNMLSHDGHGDVTPSTPYETRDRSNTSDSGRADSILDAHALTLRALESLPPDVSLSRAHLYTSPPPIHLLTYPKPQKSESFSEHRHVVLSPLQTKDVDPDRPAHLPAHFVKTPYPFTMTKEFPKPRAKPRGHLPRFSLGGEYDNRKGKHVLGLVTSEGEYDLRSRLERNEDAQGVIRPRSDGVGRSEQWSSQRSTGGVRESVVWVSLRRKKRTGNKTADRLETIIVPSSLTTTSPERPVTKKTPFSMALSKANKRLSEKTIDFDDMFFATQLRASYKTLAGPWILRALSARTLSSIQLSHVQIWSGSSSDSNSTIPPLPMGKLLAARNGLATDPNTLSPFTEHNLIDLYRHPSSGKARYTWVHWARRVAASNGALETPPSTRSDLRSSRRAKSLDSHGWYPDDNEKGEDDSSDPSSSAQWRKNGDMALPDSVTTVQFVHEFSAVRVGVVGAGMLALSMLGALLWVFLGESAWKLPESRGKAERVGGGMLIGALVLVLEGVVFAAWIVGSWTWL